MEALNAVIGSEPGRRRWHKKKRIAMITKKNAAKLAAVVFSMMLVGGTAVAQGASRGKSVRLEESRLFKPSRACRWAANSSEPSEVQSYGRAIALLWS